MLKTIIIDPENVGRCKEILEVKNIPERCVEHPHWVTWDTQTNYKSLLPHCVFRANFVIVGHAEDSMIAERL